MTLAITAQGTKLYRGATVASSPSTPTGFTDNVPELKDFQGPSQQNGEIDVTSLDSEAREFLPALKDNGSFTANFNFVPNNLQHQGLINDGDNQTVRWWRLTFPDTTLAEFPGFVQNVSTSGAPDGAISGSVSVRISGSIEWTFAS